MKTKLTEEKLNHIIDDIISEAATPDYNTHEIGRLYTNSLKSRDKSVDSKRMPFKAMYDYCIKNLGEPVGQGSSRIVFQIDDERVLKLALNAKGIAQNKAEAACFELSDSNKELFPRIYAKDKGGLWIDCEFVLPAQEDDFFECTSYDWDEICDIIDMFGQYQYYDEDSWLKKNADSVRSSDPFFAELFQYIAVDECPSGDVKRLCNWGMTRRNGVTRMVLLDSGLTWKILQDMYWKTGNTWNVSQDGVKENINRRLIGLNEAADDYFSFPDIDRIFFGLAKSDKSNGVNKYCFFRIKDYCIKHLGEPIGEGSSRIVFQIDDERVLKLALNTKGIAQNKAEAACYKRSNGTDLFPKIFDESDNGLWLECEFVLPAEEECFTECSDTGMGWWELCDIIRIMNSWDSLTESSKDFIVQMMNFEELVELLFDYIVNQNMVSGDLERICNWGMAMRHGQPRMVLLDSGLTWKILKDMYWVGGNTYGNSWTPS